MGKFALQPIHGNFENKDIISLDQFRKDDLHTLFSYIPEMKDIVLHARSSEILSGAVISLLFFEPSSRTFSSFSAAIKRLGGQTVEYQNPLATSSAIKGETLEDTIKVFEAYSDAIIIRHPQKGIPLKAAEAAEFVPIINAGDGIGEHPTQALLDLFTIYEHHKTLDNLTGVIAGDLLNGRTLHSLIRGLSLYEKITLYLLSPKELRLSKEDNGNFTKRGIKLIEIEKETDIPQNAHFWYWTRVQKERFSNLNEYERVKNRFVLTSKLVKERAGKDTIFMHPLPRVGEIDTDVDTDKRAVYLRSEIRNGLYIRMALMALVLGRI